MKIEIELPITEFCMYVEEYQSNHYGQIDKQYGYELWKKLPSSLKESWTSSTRGLYRGHDIYADVEWYNKHVSGKIEPIRSFTPSKSVAAYFGGINAVRSFRSLIESYEGLVSTRKLWAYIKKNKIHYPDDTYLVNVSDDEGEVLVFGAKLK